MTGIAGSKGICIFTKVLGNPKWLSMTVGLFTLSPVVDETSHSSLGNVRFLNVYPSSEHMTLYHWSFNLHFQVTNRFYAFSYLYF